MDKLILSRTIAFSFFKMDKVEKVQLDIETEVSFEVNGLDVDKHLGIRGSLKNEMKNVVENEPSDAAASFNDDVDGEGDSEDAYFHLPPLVTSRHRESMKRVHSNNVLKTIDMFAVNIGSACFIVGSVYFYPFLNNSCKPMTHNCGVLGGSLFIIGSFLFLQGSIISFYLSGADIADDLGLKLNSWLYILANFLFLIGSIFFIPSVVHKEGVAFGISLFVAGSVIFVVAPAYNIYRAIEFRSKGRITSYQYHVTVSTAWLYIMGSSGFVVGSVYFLPGLYQSWSITLFVVSSVCFQIATLIVPLKYANATQLPCFRSTDADKSTRTISDIENPMS